MQSKSVNSKLNGLSKKIRVIQEFIQEEHKKIQKYTI